MRCFLRRIPGTESSRLAQFAVKLARFNRAGGIPPRLMGNGEDLRGIASSLCLPIAMGRWRAAPVGHPWRFPCALRGVQGIPFLRRIPGTESSRLAHFAVKLARFDSAGGIPPLLLGNGGEVHGIASSLCLPIAMDAPRARKALRPAGFGRDLSLRSCAFALSPRFARALLGRWRAAPVGDFPFASRLGASRQPV